TRGVAVPSLMPPLSYQFDNKMLPCSSLGSMKLRPIDTETLREFLKKGGPSGITPLRSASTERAQVIRLNGAASHALEWPESIVNLLQTTTDTQRILLKAQNVAALKADDS